MPVYEWDGKPLVVDSKLAVHADCCCITNECTVPSLPATWNVTVSGLTGSYCSCASGTWDIPYLQYRYIDYGAYGFHVYDWRKYEVCADSDDLGLFFSMACRDTPPISRSWSFSISKGDLDDIFNWNDVADCDGTFTETTLPQATNLSMNVDTSTCTDDLTAYFTIN